MVKAKLTRTDGSVLEVEGSAEEVSAVLAWEARPQQNSVHFIIPATPPPPVRFPYPPSIIPCGQNTGDPLPPLPTITCELTPAPAP